MVASLVAYVTVFTFYSYQRTLNDIDQTGSQIDFTAIKSILSIIRYNLIAWRHL